MKNTLGSASRLLALLVLLALAALLGGCSRSDAPTSTARRPAGGETSALPAADRSRITTIDVSVTVDDVGQSIAKLRSATDTAGGFVSDSQSSGADSQETARIELRVPADKVRAVRGALGELGSVTSSSEKVEDVTAQRADVEARLRNARTQEKRLLELMTEKTATIRDLVEAEKEVARVRETIERLEAEERVMRSQIDLATVHVSLVTKSVPFWQTPGTSIARAGRSGLEAARATWVCVAMAIATVGPTLLPIVAFLFGVAFVVRRRRASAVSAMVG